MRHFILMLIIASAAALDQSGAEAAVARGWTALAASDTDHTQSVVAALAFAEALPFFVEKGDDEAARELQANIFWAKKRMRSDDLDAYLAEKHGDAATAKLVETMTTVADRAVAPSEAADYFAKAEAFAAAHPTEHLKLAIRYFEVASRFAGTQEAMDAQKRSLDEQVQAKTGEAKTIAKVVKPAAAPKPEAKKPGMTPLGRVVGIWTAKAPGYSGLWTFKPNKTVTRPDDRGGSFQIIGNKVVITWLSGQVETFNVPATDDATSTTDDANHLHLDRVAGVEAVTEKPKTSEYRR